MDITLDMKQLDWMRTYYNFFAGSGGLEKKSGWLEGAAVLDELV